MPDEIRINFSVHGSGVEIIDSVNKKLGATEQQSKGLVTGLGKAKASVTDFLSANKALIGVLTGVGLAVGKVLKDHLDYANAVRQQAMLADTSTEAASRYLQVLDDYKISAQDALAATRALTKEGHQPTIETLAALSDQYLSITDAQERNEFVLKNLGRGGLQWVEVLNKGSKALLEQGAAVDKNLILTQKMVDDARRAEVAMDNWADTVEALKTQLAIHLLPALTDAADGALWLTKTTLLFIDAVKEGKVAEFDLEQALRDTRAEIEGSEQAMLNNAEAASVNAEGLDNLTDSAEENEKAAKRLSDIYEGFLSSMFAINDENEQYQQSLDDLTKSSEELKAEKDRLTLAMWEEQRAGKLTNEEYLKYIEQLDEITKSQEENAKAIEQGAKDHEDASKQRVYDLVQQRLAADGVIDSGEFEYLQNLAVQHGLVSKEAATQAIEESKLADQLISSFAATQPHMDAALSTMQQIASYNGMVVNFGVNFSQSGGYAPYSLPGTVGGRTGSRSRDSGGSGFAGTAYMIGAGAQPEVFIPNTNGQFIPNADKKLGGTYNIVINNPKKETAENSIRQSLKKLSYLGIAS